MMYKINSDADLHGYKFIMAPSGSSQNIKREELLHCLYETQNDELIQLLGDHLDGNIDLSFCRLDQISCSALGYLLEQYRGVLKLVNVGYCDIGDEGCRILLTTLMSCNDNSSQLHLRMWGNDITDDCSSLIASLLSSKYPIIKLNNWL